LLWTGLARLVRAEFLALREREFVDAARASPTPATTDHLQAHPPEHRRHDRRQRHAADGRRHPPEAALGFLGFGVRRPEVSLGTLRHDYDGAYSQPAVAVPVARIFHRRIVLCLQFIGDGLRDAFDPRQKRIPKRKDSSARTWATTRRQTCSTPTRRRQSACRSCHTSGTLGRSTARRCEAQHAAGSVPTCQRTGARSRSSRGSSR
jgi:hypothetical protein